jgi:rhamnogalacturonan endolyase
MENFCFIVGLFLLTTNFVLGQNQPKAGSPVILTDDGTSFTLTNGIVLTKIDKHSASLSTLQYTGRELLGPMGIDGFWALPASNMEFGSKRDASVILDPKTNKGERAIVAVRFTYEGNAKSVPADIEIRYALGRGDSALYLEEMLHHRPEYPRLAYPVGRFVIKLNDDIFDWMTVDSRRSMQMITAYDWNHGTVMNMKEARLMNSGVMKGQVEHKYDYSAIQFDTPAYGWSSTRDKIGIWLINPSNEYMSGGATKLELIAHRDATFTDSLTAPAPATILNVWKGPHYGGTNADVEQGEEWKKTIGPFLLYCNTGETPEAAWKDALNRAAKEQSAWVYDWASDVEYPAKKDRGSVSGKIVLDDPQSNMGNLLVGLAHPDYKLANGQAIDWQHDGKYYQFWVRGLADGRFVIKNIRSGIYTLHAFADGVLGEYARTDITVEPGKSIDLGLLKWTPERYGRQLWEIGIPDRTAGEFLHGDHYYQWGLYNQYPKDFPSDVNFVIGKSDYRKDWNLMQVPRAHDDTGKGRGDETTWTVSFDLAKAPTGKATLRLSFAGTEAKSLALKMNDQQIGILTDLPNTSVIHRDSIRGFWQEKSVAFDASLMKQGTNVLKLIVPAGNVMNGIEYDYLRLELDESARIDK